MNESVDALCKGLGWNGLIIDIIYALLLTVYLNSIICLEILLMDRNIFLIFVALIIFTGSILLLADW